MREWAYNRAACNRPRTRSLCLPYTSHHLLRFRVTAVGHDEVARFHHFHLLNTATTATCLVLSSAVVYGYYYVGWDVGAQNACFIYYFASKQDHIIILSQIAKDVMPPQMNTEHRSRSSKEPWRFKGALCKNSFLNQGQSRRVRALRTHSSPKTR